MELPVKLDLNSKREASKNFDPTLFETYKHVESDAPYGIAYKNEKTVGIIEYAVTDKGIAPFLMTFDNQGHKVDSLDILKDSGFDEQGQTTESVILDDHLKLLVTGASKSWQIQENGLIEQIDKSPPKITQAPVEPKMDLSGVYEYEYEHNTENLIENHYLAFKDGNAFYYGTSDDFDDMRQGYYPGFFKAPIETMKMEGDSISFGLKVSDSIFYKQPITPMYQVGENEPWDVGVRYYTRTYTGKIKGDTIIIGTDGFGPRLFIKKKTDRND